MTSLIAWIACDSRGPASFYVASDSRISWRAPTIWNFGKKVFASVHSPDLFGYTGDVLFPFIFLSQISDFINVSNWTASNAEERHARFIQFAESALDNYPETQRNSFSFLHCTREHHGLQSRFHLWNTGWAPSTGWFDSKYKIPSESSLVGALGSGKGTIEEFDRQWRASDVGRTSRGIFSAFCDAILSDKDQLSGGAPQLVGLYRRGSGEHFGVIHEGVRYLGGLPLNDQLASALRVEWRNNLFERCDAASMQLLAGAQRHARPQ
jgi:hypothetical protein